VPQEGRVDASQPAGITLFAVEASGDLRWYRYSGDGERDPSGSRGWHRNSGNVVGNGWAVFQRVVGTGGALFGIDADGALRWYSYGGRGERDPSGTSGWARNSGAQIGHSWQHFRHVTGGSTDSAGFGTVLYAISPNGEMRWYRYDGHAEPDPSGHAGWHRNSGNPIGNGW
jgi:Tachylectin